MELFEWKLTAGQTARWYGAARYLRLIECTGSVSIEAEYEAPETDRISSKLIRGIGVDMSHPISRARVKSIAFTSSTNQTLTILISELPTTDSRLSGTVSVIDGTRAVVEAEKAFAGMVANSAVVANYGKIALWNPAGSNRVLLVRGVGVSVGAAAPVSLHKITAAIAGASPAPVNKLFSSAVATVAQMQSTSAPALTTVDYLWYANMQANQPFEIDLREYLMITPGSGVMAQAAVVNTAISMEVQYVEEVL